MKKVLFMTLLVAGMLTACNDKETTNQTEEGMTTLNLTTEWDKTFPKSDKVEHKKVTFHNRYGIELAADIYVPKVESLEFRVERLPAIAVSGPF